jgi:hypothetical protein
MGPDTLKNQRVPVLDRSGEGLAFFEAEELRQTMTGG